MQSRNVYDSWWTTVIVLSVVFCTGGCLFAQVPNHPVISEFMADNDFTLLDADGDYSDWVEVYNPTQEAVDHLTDDATDLRKWSFFSTQLAAGERLLVPCFWQGSRQPGGRAPRQFQIEQGWRISGLGCFGWRYGAASIQPWFSCSDNRRFLRYFVRRPVIGAIYVSTYSGSYE